MNTQPFAARLSNLPQSRRDSLTAIFRKAHDRVLPTPNRWVNPETSIGRYIGKVGKAKWDHIWEATGPARDVFCRLAPRIKDYLEDSVEPIPSRVTWSMYMIGRAASIASPSIIFCCEVEEHRREVRKIIRDSGILNGYPGIKTGHLSRPPDFNHLVPLVAGEQPHSRPGHAMTPTAQLKSVCGSQLLINEKGDGSESLASAATIGGVLRLGESYYYTTAAHALLLTSDGGEGLRAKNGHDTDGDALSLDGNDSEGGHSTKISSPGEQNITVFESGYSPSTGNMFEHLGESRYLQDDRPRQRAPSRHHEAYRDLPSLANLELSLNPAGKLFMTSADGKTQGAGLDYALIEVPSRFHNIENLVRTGQDDESIIKIHSIVSPDSKDTDIFAVTTRGAIRGWISGTPIYSSTASSNSSDKFFKVSLDEPLHKGDCGTWIIDATNGDLFGHIVLGSPGGNTALISSFSDIFDDILSRVGESPTFPTAQDDKSFVAREKSTSHPAQDDTADRKPPVTIRETRSQIEGFPDLPRAKGISEESTRQLLLEMESAMKQSHISEGETDISPHTAHFEVGSEPGSVANERGDLSKDLGRFVAQQRLHRSGQRARIDETSEISAQSNLSLPRIPATKRSMAKVRSNSSLPRDPATKRSSGSLQSMSSFPRDPAKGRSLGSVQSNSSLRRDPAGKQSLASIRSNSSLTRDPLREQTSGGLAQSSRPRSCIPLDIEPLDLPLQVPSDPGFRDILFTLSNIPMKWENLELLGYVLKEVDLNAIYSAAGEESGHFISRAHSMGDDSEPEWSYQDCVIRALLRYFNKSFFTRVDNPPCDVCQSEVPTIPRGNVQPSPQERAMRAQTVELYQCAEVNCQAYTRFPRYWDVWALFVTRRGRTVESATCFGMLCRALGIRVRWVWNAEDRIWTEVYSEHQKRWVHLDPYEREWDNPLLYAETWGKRMSYCIAFSIDGVTDVTRRYVRNPRHASSRTSCAEQELLRIMYDITSMRRMKMPKEDLLRLERQDNAEAKELEAYTVGSSWEVSLSKEKSGETTPRRNSVSTQTRSVQEGRL